MDTNPFAPKLESLPERLPIFPLPGVLLLPHGQLPLNIFEPRYVGMVNDALTSHRMIGMVQTRQDDSLYQTGCAGKITEFAELSDGRYAINLSGVFRFRIVREIESDRPYRLVQPDWSEFEHDAQTPKCLGVCRDTLLEHLCRYFKMHGMSCNFDKFEQIEDSKLITTLAMVCPFNAAEKQALLEEICHVERSKTFMAMLEMAARAGLQSNDSPNKHH